MTTVDGRHTLDREAERLAYKPPEVRHDIQGDMETEERVEKAMHHFVKNFNSQTNAMRRCMPLQHMLCDPMCCAKGRATKTRSMLV